MAEAIRGLGKVASTATSNEKGGFRPKSAVFKPNKVPIINVSNIKNVSKSASQWRTVRQSGTARQPGEPVTVGPAAPVEAAGSGRAFSLCRYK